ncbi:unnamed protein product [Macrosiphum euphorbiae]|uniref:Uncharacterized protein n=1 Tax=Macrosiphum euphorbiae TaxID=13131 RepID=A0AAV0W0K0_9HEMI|nr:unnamed protein product [Macrosiphum euphorbiae]
MTVLRNNKDSLMAVLEAFVYDPLLNWRLMEAGVCARRTAAATAGATVVGTNPISASLCCYYRFGKKRAWLLVFQLL